MNGNTKQLTSEGLENIKIELDELVNKKRPQVVERLSRAREEGDLSENADYQAARDELEFLDGRIDELKGIVDNSEVVESRVVKVAVNGGTHIFEIVGEWEAKPTEKKISRNSPLGEALFDKKAGDEVEVEAPAGTVKYKVLEIAETKDKLSS